MPLGALRPAAKDLTTDDQMGAAVGYRPMSEDDGEGGLTGDAPPVHLAKDMTAAELKAAPEDAG